MIAAKKEDIIRNFRVGSKSYWIRIDQNIIIISSLKKQFLDCLDSPKQIFKIAKELKRRYESTEDRLKELEKLELVERVGKTWKRKTVAQEVNVL